MQGPTGPQILAPAVGWLATLTFGLALLNLSKLRWGRTYERTNKIKGGDVHRNEQTNHGGYIHTNEQKKVTYLHYITDMQLYIYRLCFIVNKVAQVDFTPLSLDI